MANNRSIAKGEADEPSLRLAVLIDADNAQAAVIEGLLAEVARFGEATVKRVYGDFTSPHSASWKKVLHAFAIKPVQQFAYTTGKNATDSTLIIDAMDLLYTRKFDAFCLVTSDSDFTGLAIRIKEEGLTVLGFGEKKTPPAFIKACNRFIFTEVLRKSQSAETPASASPSKAAAKPARSTKSAVSAATSKQKTEVPKKFMLDALEQTCDENGWANLGPFGSYLNKLEPDFDARNHGYRNLSELVKAKTDLFIVEERTRPGSQAKQLFVHAK